MEIVQRARSWPYDAPRKVQHCGRDPSAYLTNTRSGVRLHCFRCGENEFYPHEDLSAAQIIAARALQETLAVPQFPQDAVPLEEGPVYARLWGLSVGLSPELLSRKYGFLYHPATQRVCFPIRYNGEEFGALFRALRNERPKYRALKGSGKLYSAGQQCRTPVIVEDVLSAIKIGEAGFYGLCILGTALSVADAGRILADAAVVWTDDDKAGQSGRAKIERKLGLFDIPCTHVYGDRDPKKYTLTEIKEKLCSVGVRPTTASDHAKPG